MSCVGCQAIFSVGLIDLFGFGNPIMWKIGWDDEEPEDTSGLVDPALEAATGEKGLIFQSSGESFSSAWVNPQEAAGGYLAGIDASGFRFTKDTPADHSAGEPDQITVVPLRYVVNLVDGVCSGSGSSCTTSSSCRALVELVLEITSTIQDDDGIKKLPNAQQPASAAVSDPNVEAQNIQISYSSGFGTYRDVVDPLGEGTDSGLWQHHVTQTMTVSFFIEPAECGEAAAWETNLADWTLLFTGYTMQTADQNDKHPDSDWFMSCYCLPCVQGGPITGGLGSQGGGKNQNPSSINS